MYWTFELAEYLEEAPWPANKRELLDFCHRSSAPLEVIENINELPDNDEIIYYRIEDIWQDQPTRNEYYYDEEEEE